MLVKCLHYSNTYPDGGHRVGEDFELTKPQAEYYESIGWVYIYPKNLQVKRTGGALKKLLKHPPAHDLSVD